MKYRLFPVYGLLGVSLFLTGCGGDGHDGSDGVDGKDASSQVVGLERVGRTASQGFDVSAAEIVDYDKQHNRIFVVNADSGRVDVFSDLTSAQPALYGSLDLAQMLVDNAIVSATSEVGAANSISVYGDYAAVAVEANTKTDNGWVIFLNTSDLSYARAVQVGALPDMVTFAPDGSKVLVANEGEPNSDYSVDPDGSVSVVSMSDYSVINIGFTDFNVGGSRNGELPTDKMVLDGFSATTSDNKATVAQSFEPEYISVAADNSKAYVTLQESNAVAVINLNDSSVDKIIGLGFKDHSIPGNELDASQKDGVHIQNWPVMGMYMPDSITSMTYNGKTYLLTANEGDDRQDWLENVTDQAACEAAGYYFDSSDNCVDAFSAKDYYDSDNVTLDSNMTSSDNGGFGDDDELRRLKFSYHTSVVQNGGTDFEKLYAYGARSFTIWDAETGEQVFDSGSDFERLTALRYGDDFNNDNAENSGDDRSDNKGPEPEAITVGQVNGHTYAFIGLERMGGIMVYDVSNPYAPQYVQYINDRDLSIDPDDNSGSTYSVDAGDLGPEGFKFVSASDSGSGKPYLIVGNEVSGTTAIYEVKLTRLSD
ncbi:hypothetical protein AVO42_11460 [Thiomicrospira sp. XS5]|nr:hypothetical protein AVO42_11460 [Thiomicrospira sp. XS5]